MTEQCPLSHNTLRYIEEYQSILTQMYMNMTSTIQTDSISQSFILQMLPHHQAAIDMSRNLLFYTTNIPLQNIALNIISSQEKSIAQMKQAYPRCCRLNTSSELSAYRTQNDTVLKTMFCQMSFACTDNNIDTNFIREMIPHHRGAVHMSENALRFPLCPELIPILETIIAQQKQGILQMQKLLPSTVS